MTTRRERKRRYLTLKKCEAIIMDEATYKSAKCRRYARPSPDPVDGKYYCFQHGPTNVKENPTRES